MTGGVKGPNGPVYTPDISTNDETHSSPVINPKPQIPKTPNQAPQKSILKNRSAQKVTARPQVNKKAREKLELESQGQNLVAQLSHLMAQQQFIGHKAELLKAVAHPGMLPEDFTIVYIDENGQEVTVIPPDPYLQSNPGQETRLRNQLKAQVYQLDEVLTDEDAEGINEAIVEVTEIWKYAVPS